MNLDFQRFSIPFEDFTKFVSFDAFESDSYIFACSEPPLISLG